MVMCSQCSQEVPEDEIDFCPHCERDGLCQACIGVGDHPCTYGEEDEEGGNVS